MNTRRCWSLTKSRRSAGSAKCLPRIISVIPDIIVLARRWAPPAAGRDHHFRQVARFDPDTEELHTFASPTPSMVTAAKQLQMLEQGVLENCRQMGAYPRAPARHDVNIPRIGDVRQAGLHIGAGICPRPTGKQLLEKETVAIRNAGMKNGVIFGLGGVRRMF